MNLSSVNVWDRVGEPGYLPHTPKRASCGWMKMERCSIIPSVILSDMRWTKGAQA